MVGHTIESTVNHNVAILFLTDYIVANYSEGLNIEWSSYGVKLGSRGQEITPLNLVSISNGISVWNAPEGMAPDAEMELRLFIILIVDYRYSISSEITQCDYKSTVLGKINQVIRNDPFNLDSDPTPTEMSHCKT